MEIAAEKTFDDFQRVRDFVDVKLCKSLPAFAPECLRNGFSKDMVKEAKAMYKIKPGQCRMVYEILRLYLCDDIDSVDYADFKKIVSDRLEETHQKKIRSMKGKNRVISSTTEADQLKQEREVKWLISAIDNDNLSVNGIHVEFFPFFPGART